MINFHPCNICTMYVVARVTWPFEMLSASVTYPLWLTAALRYTITESLNHTRVHLQADRFVSLIRAGDMQVSTPGNWSGLLKETDWCRSKRSLWKHPRTRTAVGSNRQLSYNSIDTIGSAKKRLFIMILFFFTFLGLRYYYPSLGAKCSCSRTPERVTCQVLESILLPISSWPFLPHS